MGSRSRQRSPRSSVEQIAHSLRVQSKLNRRRPSLSSTVTIPWCAYCGRLFDHDDHDAARTRDHIVPAHRFRTRQSVDGGENLVDVCRGCNFSKKDELWLRWLLGNPFMGARTS